MTDLSTTIIAKSDQLNSEDLLSGPRDIVVTDVRGATGDQPISIFFEGDNNKPFKPCKSMRRLLVYAWGSDGSQYVGRSMTLFNDPQVKWAGKPVGGIRISELSHIDKDFTLALTVTRGMKKPYAVKKMQTSERQPPAPEVTPQQAYEAAKVAADKGTAVFKVWWASDEGKRLRGWIAEADMVKVKEACAKADDDIPPMDR